MITLAYILTRDPALALALGLACYALAFLAWWLA